MKRTLARMGYYSGLLCGRYRARRGGFFHILMYHHVSDDPEPFLPHVTRRVFARQLNFVKSRFRVLALDRLAGMIRAGEPIPDRALALTFDDEYEDVYRNAFPLLRQSSLPATVFITTGGVDTDRIPWTDELGFLFKKTSQSGLQLDRGGEREVFAWTGVPSRLAALRRLKEVLKNAPEDERSELFGRIRRQLAVKERNPSRILNRREIREMAENGIDFGSHTVNHPILTRVSASTAREEIARSKRDLEKIVGDEVTGFCYPNGQPGDFDPSIVSMVREAGFRYACTTIDGTNDAATDPYALRRTWTSETSLSLFAVRLLRRR